MSADEATVPLMAWVTTAAMPFNKAFRRISGGCVGAGAAPLFSLASIAIPYASVAVTVITVVVRIVLTTVSVKVAVTSIAVIVEV